MTASAVVDRDTDERAAGSLPGHLARVGRPIATFLGPVVVLDAVLGFSLMFVMHNVTPKLPGGLLTALAVALVGAVRRPVLTIQWGGLLALCTTSILVFLVVESMHNHMPWAQRITKFVILAVASATVATGRIEPRSLIAGGGFGALVNVLLWMAHVAPDPYHPYLTGFYGDKNVAGMYYALWGILGLLLFRTNRSRVVWGALFAALLFATGSRTAMGGYILALLWVLLRNRVGLTFRLVLSALGFWLLTYAVKNFAESSAFGDRQGTDWYRHQIELAMAAKVAVTPWYGLGLTQGVVTLGGVRDAFFHDSYQQAFVEGGYPFLWGTLILFVVVGLGLFSSRVRVPPPLLISEAGIIVILVCAWKLGEVFMTLGAFLTLALCIAYRLGRDIDPNDDLSTFEHVRSSARPPMPPGGTS